METIKELEKGCNKIIGFAETFEGSGEGENVYCGE